MVSCPECGTKIQPTWDWCLRCGFDPEGLKPTGWEPPSAPPPPPPSVAAQAGFRPDSLSGLGYDAPRAPGYGPPSTKSSGGLVAVIAIVVAAVILIPIVLIGAVTLLGKNTSSKFSRIDTAIDSPLPSTVPTTERPPVVWTAWTAPDGTFSVDFSSVPEVQDLGVDPSVREIVDAHLAIAEVGDDAAYFVIWFDVTADALSPTEAGRVLAGGVDGFTGRLGTGGSYDHREIATFAGMPSLAFTYRSSGSAAGTDRVEGLAIMSGSRMYLFAAGHSFDTPALDFAHFRDSFRIN